MARSKSPSQPKPPKAPKHRKQANLTIRIRIPRHLPPSDIIQALQDHAPVIRHQAYVTNFEPAPVPLDSLIHDPFFLADGQRIATYLVQERIALAPGGVVSHLISFNVTFQNVPGGVRCRADAPGGVVVRSEYLVMSAKKADEMFPETRDASIAEDGEEGEKYDLIETSSVESHSLLLPFVSRSMTGAHKEICQKLIDEVSVKFRW